MKVVGKNYKRVDAEIKVTGEAKYTDDLDTGNMLVAKILHSTIANGLVKNIDISEALKVDGVVKIVTCFDVPDIQFSTPGHPWSTDVSNHDDADRKLLNKRVRYYGDDIAVVIAENALQATKALKKIKVDYEVYKPILDPEEAMNNDGEPIHEEYADNIASAIKLHKLCYEFVNVYDIMDVWKK